jgi:hypothetical protein
LLFANPQPADAKSCVTDLTNCYYRAARVDSWWYRFAAGLDCEITFVGCLREAFAGW